MENTILQLQSIVSVYADKLRGVSEEQWVHKPNPLKWSKKEILGHLVDSAQNNMRRFVVAQYEENPKIVYDQDRWVAAAGYQYYVTPELIELWVLLNGHICRILTNMPEDFRQRMAETNQSHPIAWLAADYNKHLLHHLHQVLDLEPVAYP